MKTTSNDYRNDFPNDEFQLNKSLNIFNNINFKDIGQPKDCYDDGGIDTSEEGQILDAKTMYERWLEESPVNLEDCF